MKLKLPHFKLWGPQTLSFYLILIPARTWEWLETLDIIFKTATLYSTVFGKAAKGFVEHQVPYIFTYILHGMYLYISFPKKRWSTCHKPPAPWHTDVSPTFTGSQDIPQTNQVRSWHTGSVDTGAACGAGSVVGQTHAVCGL